ncbi:hypothetical protein [Microbacterium halotolerans]|uniref:hypothetical protein n=1 Tax=Microbacterium halotolerans TaxID=246613 RepID=UPI0013C2A8AB|nr:hypothetical protein [Microbacterium halotolerans]
MRKTYEALYEFVESLQPFVKKDAWGTTGGMFHTELFVGEPWEAIDTLLRGLAEDGVNVPDEVLTRIEEEVLPAFAEKRELREYRGLIAAERERRAPAAA